MKTYLLKTLTILSLVLTLTLTSCGSEEEPTSCSNGVMDSTETGVDCGGDCPPCPTTVANCTDGIQNGDETGVDCGGATCPPCNTNAEPTPTKTYYVKYKVDGVWKLYQTNSPGWQDCGSCACFITGSVLTSSNYGAIEVCSNVSTVSPGLIQSWEQDSLSFDFNVPGSSAAFSFDEGGTGYGSLSGAGAPGWMYMSSIVSDGSFVGLQQFKATGTFECTVRNNGVNYSVTDGTFVIRLSQGN